MAPASQLECIFNIATLGFWIQTLCFTLSALAACIALAYNANQLRQLKRQNYINEQQAKLRATVDTVLHERHNPLFQEHRKTFAKLRNGGDGSDITIFACSAITPENEKENQSIIEILNNHEFMAVGIANAAFDEKTYMELKKSSVIYDWNTLKPYVFQLRIKNKNDRLFISFEKLAESWKVNKFSVERDEYSDQGFWQWVNPFKRKKNKSVAP